MSDHIEKSADVNPEIIRRQGSNALSKIEEAHRKRAEVHKELAQKNDSIADQAKKLNNVWSNENLWINLNSDSLRACASANATISNYGQFIERDRSVETEQNKFYSITQPLAQMALTSTSATAHIVQLGLDPQKTLDLPDPNLDQKIKFVEENLPKENQRKAFKQAWESFNYGRSDPLRVATAAMVEVINHFFRQEAPKDKVAESGVPLDAEHGVTRAVQTEYLVRLTPPESKQTVRSALENMRDNLDLLNKIKHLDESLESHRSTVKSWLTQVTNALHAYLMSVPR